MPRKICGTRNDERQQTSWTSVSSTTTSARWGCNIILILSPKESCTTQLPIMSKTNSGIGPCACDSDATFLHFPSLERKKGCELKSDSCALYQPVDPATGKEWYVPCTCFDLSDSLTHPNLTNAEFCAQIASDQHGSNTQLCLKK